MFGADPLIHTSFIKICLSFVWISGMVHGTGITVSSHRSAHLWLLLLLRVAAISSISLHPNRRRRWGCAFLATLMIVTRVAIAHHTVLVVIFVIYIEHVVYLIVERAIKVPAGSVATFRILTLSLVTGNACRRRTLFRASDIAVNMGVIIAWFGKIAFVHGCTAIDFRLHRPQIIRYVVHWYVMFESIVFILPLWFLQNHCLLEIDHVDCQYHDDHQQKCADASEYGSYQIDLILKIHYLNLSNGFVQCRLLHAKSSVQLGRTCVTHLYQVF